MPKDTNLVRASLKGLGIAPRKVAVVASLVRGRSVDDALIILANTPRRSALPIKKLIESAKANALNNHNFKAEGLVIAEIAVNAGARLKRYRPVARGMAHPFIKRQSNVYVTLTGDKKPAKEQVSTKTTVKKVEKGAKK
jgi:large subunit ribosomal protein L22